MSLFIYVVDEQIAYKGFCKNSKSAQYLSTEPNKT